MYTKKQERKDLKQVKEMEEMINGKEIENTIGIVERLLLVIEIKL